MAPPEESWPLVRKVPQTRKSAAGCRELLQWCLLHEHNPRFAECAELALRSAFALVICGLPFLLPEGLFPRLDWFVDAGFYATTVVSFIVLHIKTNLGATLAATSSGLRGVLLAVCNSWFLFGLFPDGYTTDESDLVWWFGFAEGLFFIFCLVYLNFDTGAMIFSIKLFSGYWMQFLRADSEGFSPPWTPSFSLYKNKGVQDLTNICLGSFITQLVFLFPYPRLALQSAKEAASEMTHEVPHILRLFVFYLESEQGNDYEQDRILRNIRRLQEKGGTLGSNIKHAWWECCGWGHRQSDRLALSHLDRVLHDCYDSIQGIWSVSELTKQEARSEKHLAMIKVVKDRYLPLLDVVEELLSQVVFAEGHLVVFSDQETLKVRGLISEIQTRQTDFRQAFYDERRRLLENLKTLEIAEAINELEVIHAVAAHMMMVVNGFRHYAEKVLEQKDEGSSCLCDMEGFGISSLFKGVATVKNVRYSFRVVVSVLLGFFTGYYGGGMVNPGTPAIAKATATLLSKFPGSALVKNLSRIQGVVLGTVFGQLLDTLFHRSSYCSYWNEVLLGFCFANYIFATIFIHFYVTDFAIMGIQMANFGGTEMMTGNCGEEENTSKAESIITINLLAIIFLVSVDLVFASERASDMATSTLLDAWSQLKTKVVDIMAPDKPVCFSSSDLKDILARAESLGREASHEPRYWRVAWRSHMFENVLKEMHDVRYALSSLERLLAQRGNDGADKVRYFQQVLKSESMTEWSRILLEKFDLISSMLEVFTHETHTRWSMLDNEKVTKQFRLDFYKVKLALLEEIVREDLYTPEEVSESNLTSFRDDPLCMLSIFLACSDAMLLSMRQTQHHILQMY